MPELGHVEQYCGELSEEQLEIQTLQPRQAAVDARGSEDRNQHHDRPRCEKQQALPLK